MSVFLNLISGAVGLFNKLAVFFNRKQLMDAGAAKEREKANEQLIKDVSEGCERDARVARDRSLRNLLYEKYRADSDKAD